MIDATFRQLFHSAQSAWCHSALHSDFVIRSRMQRKADILIAIDLLAALEGPTQTEESLCVVQASCWHDVAVVMLQILGWTTDALETSGVDGVDNVTERSMQQDEQRMNSVAKVAQIAASFDAAYALGFLNCFAVKYLGVKSKEAKNFKPNCVSNTTKKTKKHQNKKLIK